MPLMEAGRQPNSVGTEAVAAKNATHSAWFAGTSRYACDKNDIQPNYNTNLRGTTSTAHISVYLLGTSGNVAESCGTRLRCC
jgi:hypothetical protein